MVLFTVYVIEKPNVFSLFTLVDIYIINVCFKSFYSSNLGCDGFYWNI